MTLKEQLIEKKSALKALEEDIKAGNEEAMAQGETYANEIGAKFESYAVHATDVKLNKSEAKIWKGNKETLEVTVEPVNCTDVIVWKTCATRNPIIIEIGVFL